MNSNKSKEEIFKKIFFEYHTPLCNYAFQYTFEKAAAQDIVQDVLCELWLQMDKIDFSYSVDNLLYKYTRNKAINYLSKAANNRKDKIEELSLSDYVRNLVIDDQVEVLHLKDLMESLEKGINNLPPQCKSIFILSRKDGLKNKDIAQVLGISIKAVEKQITKALFLLKDHLIENGFSVALIITLLSILF
ncbi:RNA polymerase sigma-70 factor [Dysgonomonas termitidis]|uniref:RNA polymerase sigma-70 factor n=1 Tax=Dysgonomonas termitidis TaxID=1516126 RepID=A0ABV9KRW8_9BACT